MWHFLQFLQSSIDIWRILFFDRRDCAYPTGQKLHHVLGMYIIPIGMDIRRVVATHIKTMNPPMDASLSEETRSGFLPRRTIRNITAIAEAMNSLNFTVLNLPGIRDLLETFPSTYSRNVPRGQSHPHQNLPSMGLRSSPPTIMNPIRRSPISK